MPRIVDYDDVLRQMQELGLRCVYHYGGAFAFVNESHARSVGWIGEDDPTIRLEMRELTRQIVEPHAPNMARMLKGIARDHIRSSAWVMPASHWAFELQFGSSDWLPDALRKVGIDPQALLSRNDASAVEFSLDEVDLLESLVHALLTNLKGSDFVVAFPARPVICRVHHHKQLWWTTTDAATAREDSVDEFAANDVVSGRAGTAVDDANAPRQAHRPRPDTDAADFAGAHRLGRLKPDAVTGDVADAYFPRLVVVRHIGNEPALRRAVNSCPSAALDEALRRRLLRLCVGELHAE